MEYLHYGEIILMFQIDVAMTAALRPEIIERTLTSIRSKLHWAGGFNLIVDIASVGDKQYSQKQVEKGIRNYFPEAKVRIKKDSFQAEALKWTWRNSNSPYMLQWEDDWVLERDIYLQDVMNKMKSWYGYICFDRIKKSVLDYPGYKDHFVKTDHTIWERIKGKSLGGPPALMKAEYVKAALRLIDGTKCLDTMSHEPLTETLLDNWGVAVYLREDGEGNLVRDIGKDWRKERGLVMKKNTMRGVEWTKV